MGTYAIIAIIGVLWKRDCSMNATIQLISLRIRQENTLRKTTVGQRASFITSHSLEVGTKEVNESNQCFWQGPLLQVQPAVQAQPLLGLVTILNIYGFTWDLLSTLLQDTTTPNNFLKRRQSLHFFYQVMSNSPNNQVYLNQDVYWLIASTDTVSRNQVYLNL